jgi:hypothetical protein
MIRRVGRPGLLGTMARTAVIAGTATAVSGGMQRRQQARYEESNRAQQQTAEMDDMQQQMAAMQSQPAPTATAPAPQTDLVAEIQKLGELKQAGLLTNEEFASAKARLLGTLS